MKKRVLILKITIIIYLNRHIIYGTLEELLNLSLKESVKSTIEEKDVQEGSDFPLIRYVNF